MSNILRLLTPQVLLHGDAAFAGQGIVYETMQLAKVKDFANGGTIHIVVNNQVHPHTQTHHIPFTLRLLETRVLTLTLRLYGCL